MANLDIEQPIIIKKIKKGGHGHHGGAWKVAYADFVTAMMAFFLLLWLLNATTEEQKSGLADYFSPASVSSPSSGAGGVLGGKSISVEGNRVSAGGPSEGGVTLPIPPDLSTPTEEQSDESDPEKSGPKSGESDEVDEAEVAELLAKREQEQFEAAEEALRDAIEAVPELEELQDSLIIEQTPEGLRIQLVDQDGLSMFASGSAKPNDHLVKLIGLVAEVVTQLPNKVSISGHTDSNPYRGGDHYTNWELSSDRANTARRLLTGAGLDLGRVADVQGRAATEPLLPEDTVNASNRRISMVLLRENPLPDPEAAGKVPRIIGNTEDRATKKQRPATPEPGAQTQDARTLHLER
jgi:chemotaxis protein MotB